MAIYSLTKLIIKNNTCLNKYRSQFMKNCFIIIQMFVSVNINKKVHHGFK